MGSTFCVDDVTPHSAVMKGMALLGRALPMVELVMTMIVMKTIHFFLKLDQLCGFSGSLVVQETMVTSALGSSGFELEDVDADRDNDDAADAERPLSARSSLRASSASCFSASSTLSTMW